MAELRLLTLAEARLRLFALLTIQFQTPGILLREAAQPPDDSDYHANEEDRCKHDLSKGSHSDTNTAPSGLRL